MTRAVPEWIGKTDDTAIPNRIRLRIYGNGICAKCGRKLRPGHWDCDHVIALKNGGENRETNLQPLCNSPCHSNKTKQDVAEKSRTYRKRSRHAGIKKRTTFRGWKRFDGTPVRARG
jgi:5-methylcytosine-specific restriction endonuclease McrA